MPKITCKKEDEVIFRRIMMTDDKLQQSTANPSGVYFYKLETRDFSSIKEMVLLK